MREIFTARRRFVTAVAAVALAIGCGTVLPAAADQPTGQVLYENSHRAIPDSYIVTLKTSCGFTADSAKGRLLAAKYGATVQRTYGRAINGYAIRINSAGAHRFAADRDVAHVERDQRVSIDATQTNAPWNLDRIDQARLPLNRSYTYPDTAGGGATIYVIDTGVRITHRQIFPRAVYGYDAIDRDMISSDGNGHGTHVATTAAGTTYGVAKAAKVVAVRVLDNNGSGSTSGVIAGVDWVTRTRVGPSVANMSLGGAASTALDNAVRNSIASGVSYAIAAGNASTNAGSTSPARVTQALTVGASTSTDARASYSNYGSVLDLFAPGSAITAGWRTSDTATATLSGTSMATPHVAGAAAIYLTSHPLANPATVHSAIVNGATNGVLSNVGAGSPNKLLRIVP